ncbi:hypothetical protein NLX67_00530 [Domibacillus sp. A3M-37]|jgi:urea transporter|uniref:hypothetical protein n=1 Tax=Domibacillus TaxID=1433999 RepID=UPI000617AA11|nr:MULTISPECIES: hypothetical protein [Domibacillus]MCP3760880.1 hypothetical protein [Domibacillus sp. A3M-37]
MIASVFLVPSILAVLFFLTAASLLKKVQAGKDGHNETLLGAVLAFFLVLSFLISILMIQEF